jgi:hypothetical protein
MKDDPTTFTINTTPFYAHSVCIDRDGQLHPSLVEYMTSKRRIPRVSSIDPF